MENQTNYSPKKTDLLTRLTTESRLDWLELVGSATETNTLALKEISMEAKETNMKEKLQRTCEEEERNEFSSFVSFHIQHVWWSGLFIANHILWLTKSTLAQLH